MVRIRLASLAVALGLGLTSGCSLFSGHSLFHRDKAITSELPEGCTDLGGCGVTEGPILGDPGPGAASSCPGTYSAPPPGSGTYTVPPSGVPQQTMPPLAAPPRLVPQPESQPTPYRPTKRDSI